MTHFDCTRAMGIAAALGLGLLLAGCRSDPVPHLARVNASVLTHVVCAGVDQHGADTNAPGRATCDAAKGAEKTMDPRPEWGEVAIFEMAQVRHDTTPPLPVAAPGQAPDTATVGPYKDTATCEAVRGVVNGLGIRTSPCERRFMLGKMMIAY